MNDNQFDDFLRQQLQGSSTYIDDGDFSASVIASLPKPKRVKPWLERFIVCAPVTLIALLVLHQFSPRAFIQPLYAWVLTFNMSSLITLAVAVMVIMVAIPLSLLLRRSSLF